MTEVLCPKCAFLNQDSNKTCTNCGNSLEGGLAFVSQNNSTNSMEGDVYKIGDIINGRYHILSIIGRGGMGVVYQVRDNVLQEELALKVLLPHFADDKSVVERFINEVRITRKIAHPNIVRVHDIGSMGNSLYISMEYVDGESLRNIMKARGKNQPLTVRQAVYIVSQLCIALKYAHRYTIHRDIKPDNIMITRNNHVKLMDFGISKLKGEKFQTLTDAAIGTPCYMAPEQMQHTVEVDGRADIYSLGVVLYELVTGRLPVGIYQPASQIAQDVPLELDNIIKKCLESDPNKRYQSPAELREALRKIAESFHESSSPGFVLESPSPTPNGKAPISSANVTSAMEAFMREERAREAAMSRSEKMRPIPSPMASNTTQPYLGSELIQDWADNRLATQQITPKPYHRHQPTFWERYNTFIKIALIGSIFLSVGAAFLFRNLPGKTPMESPDQVWDAATVEALSNERIMVTGSLVEALAVAKKAYEISREDKDIQVLNNIREKFINDVEKRIYSRPFDMKKLNSASNDMARVLQIDNTPSIRSLADKVNHEIAQFKFVLIALDNQKGIATFRLNNIFSNRETEEVSVGDLLQGRFLVTRLGVRTVFLEDTAPEGAGRLLVARLFEQVAAE